MWLRSKKNVWMHLAMAVLFTIAVLAGGGCGGSSSSIPGDNQSDPGDGDDTPALEFEYGDVYSISVEFNGTNTLNFEYQPLEDVESTSNVQTAADVWSIMTAASGAGHFVYIGGTGFLANTETFSHELVIEGVEVSLQVSNADGSTQARIDINVEQRTYEVTFIENGVPKEDASFDPDDGLKVNDEPVELHNPDSDDGDGDNGDGDDNVDPDPTPDPDPDPDPDPTPNPDPTPDPDPEPDPDPTPDPDPDPDPTPTPGPTKYTVTFDSNGGTGSMASLTVNSGTAVTLTANTFTWASHRFDGWATSATGSVVYQDQVSVTVTGNLTLYAHWTPYYTVTFQTAGGSKVTSQTVISGGKASQPTDPTWTGYRFDGWYTSEGYTTAFDFDTSVTGNLTIFAKWTPYYTVVFDTGGGSSVANQTIISGGQATKPAAPTRDGYQFDGWYADEEYKSEYKFDSSVTANITIYAKWTALYTVTFMSQGVIRSTETVASGSKATKPIDPTRDNFRFGGWYQSSDGGTTLGDTAFDFDTAITADLTLYAKWNPLLAINSGLTDSTLGKLTFYSDSALQTKIERAAPGDTVYVLAEAGPDKVRQNNLRRRSTGSWALERALAYYSDPTDNTTVYVDVTNSTGAKYDASFTMPAYVVMVTADFGEQYAFVNHQKDGSASNDLTPEDYVLIGDKNKSMVYDKYTYDLPTGFYVLAGTNTFSERATMNGDVQLLLLDDSDNTAAKGITVANDKSLTIYAQSGGTGKLTAKAAADGGDAGIGGASGGSNGEITIHGGVITAIGSSYSAGGGAGIGGSTGQPGGTVVIYGGTVTATGGAGIMSAAGIGAGDSVTNHGQLMVANTLQVLAGDTENAMTALTASQSTATLDSYDDRARYMSVIKGPVMLTATTTAWADGDTYAVPSGGLTCSDAITVAGAVTLTLTENETLTLNKGISLADGATLTVQGKGTMAINGSHGSTASTVTGTGTLVLTSGTLTVMGGNGQGVTNYSGNTNASANAGGVAINGNVNVSGGTLIVTGGSGGGIGMYSGSSAGAAGGTAISGNVTINNGMVTATGGNGGSVGQGSSNVTGAAGGTAIGGSVTISNGTLTAKGGDGGSLSGTNSGSNCGAGGAAIGGAITITGGMVTATGGNGGSDNTQSAGAKAGAGGAGIAGDATLNGGTLTTTDGSAGDKKGDGTVGAAGKAISGTLTDNYSH